MSLATISQAAGFRALLSAHGETVTLMLPGLVDGVRCQAIIDRRNMMTIQGKLTVRATEGSVIQLPLTVGQPKVSSIIKDSSGLSHTVNQSNYMGHCWECRCDCSRDV